MKTIENTYESLVEEKKSLFEAYVHSLPIEKEFCHYLTDDSFFAKNPSMYLIYPLLFEENFSVYNQEQLDQLCVAGYLYYRSVLENDTFLDSPEALSQKQMFTVVSSIAQEESVKLLTHLFGLQSKFWEVWNLRRKEYLKALRMEQLHRDFITCKSEVKQASHEKEFLRQSITLAEYEKLADYKSAFGKVAIDATYLLSGSNDTHVYQRLLESHALFSVGFQILDDIDDFKRDFDKPQINIAYIKLTEYCNQQGINLPINDFKMLHKYLYVSGVASDLTALAIEYFAKALVCIEGLSLSFWAKSIADKKIEAEKIFREINIYNKLIDIRLAFRNSAERYPNFSIRLPETNQNLARGLANDALKTILDEWQKDFGEVKHVMYLGKDEGFASESEYHIGDVFQRALIAEALAEVNPFFDQQLDFVLDKETDYLLSKKLTIGVGGWNYFPTVPEIAPDADDLGQIIQVFSKSGFLSKAKEHFELPLEVLLSDNYRDNGSFETWIVPKTGRTLLQEVQEMFNQTKWGKGPDTEVVANLIHGLQVYDYTQFSDIINKGIDYLASVQESDGSWKSRWYFGPFYGTYVAVRALVTAKKNTEAVQRAKVYLEQSQNENGGWQFLETGSDPLSTAIALCTLGLIKDSSSDIITRGLAYLRRVQKPDNTWAGVKFIAPKVNEPYGSSTLTAIYVLKASVSHCY
jgi:squalene-hopene/tetraprenyl-beta-curcumene cyclase